MNITQYKLEYENPSDYDILEAYINKNVTNSRREARQIKRALKKLYLVN